MARFSLLFPSLAVLCAVPAPAQHKPEPAPIEVLGALSLSEATVQVLTVPSDAMSPFAVTVSLGSRSVILDLSPFEIRSDDFKLFVQTTVGVREDTPAESVTMRGVVRDNPGSTVAANVVAGGIQAVVHLNGQRWWLTPTSEGRHAVYLDEAVDGEDASCGVDHKHEIGGGSLTATGGGTFEAADIYVDADHAYYLAQGGGIPQFTQAAATAQINLVSAVYEGQLGLGYRINAVYVQAVFEQYPSGATGTFADMLALLNEFSQFWNTHPQFSAFSRDAVHLLSGKGTWSGTTVGIANIGVVCNRPIAYGVSRVVNGNVTLNTALVAHEFGHNWSAQHCDLQPTCGVMNSIITGSLTFGTSSVSSIGSFASGLSCLSTAANARYSYFGSGCVGTNGQAPKLANASLPMIGQTFSLDVTQCPQNALGVMALGFSNTVFGSLTLPFDLSPGMPGCFLLVAINQQFPIAADSAGVATFSAPIPNSPSLLGTCFYNQASMVDPGVNPRNLTVSDGGDGSIGN